MTTNKTYTQELVSIITPLYNGEKFIQQTIDSVIAQTYPYWEMIVVNDGSTDNGAKIVNAYAQRDERIQLHHQANHGWLDDAIEFVHLVEHMH